MGNELTQLIVDHPYMAGAAVLAGSLALTGAYLGAVKLTDRIAKKICNSPKSLRMAYRIGLTNLTKKQVDRAVEIIEERERL